MPFDIINEINAPPK
ncbi:hypothetical protein D049_3360A, partial [Vibrio parahaemolyticus VPTS-2010]